MNGRLYQMMQVENDDGSTHHVIVPFHVELTVRDLMQILAGAALFALPMVFTGEVWDLGSELPFANIITLTLFSLAIVAIFVYAMVYRDHLHSHRSEYIQRVLATYLISILISAILLTLLDRAPWRAELALAVKRTLIVAFPSSMSAAIGDNLS